MKYQGPEDPSKKNKFLKSKQVAEIKAVTWNKDSHGLFDYENSYYDMRKFQISYSVRLFREDNEVQISKKTDFENKNNLQYLLSVTKDESPRSNSSKYYIDVPGDFPQGQRAPNPTYLIVRSLKCKDGRSQRGYHLKMGDVIKLGRIEYRVLEIQSQHGATLSNNNEQNLDFLIKDDLFDADTQIIKSDPKHDEKLCKYCLMDEISDDKLENCMLYPCDCENGVHFLCLKKWFQYKIIAKNNTNIATYQWKKLQCEICLKPLPRRVKYQDSLNELITIEKPTCPYIIVEKLTTDNSSPTLSLIVPEGNNNLKLGRGHQCDLRISDISVSRIHAYLKFEDGKFLIFDNDSKFGTLILLNNKYPVKLDKAAVQIGRTVFTFVIKNVSTEN
jgi:hypothetical protein